MAELQFIAEFLQSPWIYYRKAANRSFSPCIFNVEDSERVQVWGTNDCTTAKSSYDLWKTYKNFTNVPKVFQKFSKFEQNFHHFTIFSTKFHHFLWYSMKQSCHLVSRFNLSSKNSWQILLRVRLAISIYQSQRLIN